MTLASRPEHLLTVARWIYDEWDHVTDRGLDAVVERMAGRMNEDRIPLTLVALRGGQALDRVVGLIRLMAATMGDSAPANVVLPTRQDIADITALRLETVSRIIKSLERAGMLHPVRVAGVHATRSFTVDFRHLAA